MKKNIPFRNIMNEWYAKDISKKRKIVVIHYNCIGQFTVPSVKNIPDTNIVMETIKGVAVSYSPERSA